MARTLEQVNAEIAKLQREAEALKAKEVAGVIARIQEAIAYYELTVEDLFAPGKPRAARKAAAKPAPAKTRQKSATKSAGVVRFKDENGNTWTGHGKRPRWFVAALKAGRTPQDLEVVPD